MNAIRLITFTVLCGTLVSCGGQQSSLPPQDTPENRRHAAEEYLRIVPPADLMRDTAEKVAETLPEPARPAFLRAMTQELDMRQLNTAMTDSMVRRFTVAEINALAQFYGSAEGKSVMKKFGLYMADVMPVIQAETMKAIAKAKESTK